MNALTLAALSDSAAAKAVADEALTQVEGVSTAVATAEAAATAAQTAAEGAQTEAHQEDCQNGRCTRLSTHADL